jgi:hypothetical protein
LSVLNGKELFAFNAALFIDDDAAIDASEEKELEEQGRKEREREEQEEAMERARAQVRLWLGPWLGACPGPGSSTHPPTSHHLTCTSHVVPLPPPSPSPASPPCRPSKSVCSRRSGSRKRPASTARSSGG